MNLTFRFFSFSPWATNDYVNLFFQVLKFSFSRAISSSFLRSVLSNFGVFSRLKIVVSSATVGQQTMHCFQFLRSLHVLLDGSRNWSNNIFNLFPLGLPDLQKFLFLLIISPPSNCCFLINVQRPQKWSSRAILRCSI